MKTHVLEPQDVDDAIMTGGYGICLEDGVLVDLEGHADRFLSAADFLAHQTHTILPIPEKTEEDERQDVETYCNWLVSLPDEILSPENKQKAIALVREQGDVWQVVGDVEEMMDVDTSYAEYDSVDRIREQFIITLNQRAPEGVRFRYAEEE
jgi:hypothetical protein